MHLPEDLVVEILYRVPAVSLARLRSISKGWNALIKNGRVLAKKHSAYAPRQPPLFIMLIDFRVYLVSVDLHGFDSNNVAPSAKLTGQFSLKDPLSKDVDIRNAFHCDGLLLCSTTDNRLVVWNPCSGATRWIQPRHSYDEYDCYALGYDNISSCYKILRMHRRFVDYQWRHTLSEVYDFASNSWSSVGVSTTTDWYILPIHSRGIYVKGTTYWLAYGRLDDRFLVSFDFSRERFQSLFFPADANIPRGKHVVLSVTREEQQLCMFSTCDFANDEGFFSDVWISTKMEGTGTVSWTKSHRFHSKIYITVSADHEKKVLVCEHILGPYHSIDIVGNVLHIVGEDIHIRRVNVYGEIRCPFLFTYVPSLVQIQQAI
ncbi:PREDICTED: LOW QUALITY PROTEIN: putative F-box protein At3g21120 [Camelina sativa]|uniref:LOW QUALITY PROTEIN: putative F-box protein At3g21120 n=1 Tax=Camelina sativa TaxID=90675 RepID=A0ABM1QZR5_CAMSA|nr:PREDICTED: LOW QUALITY PROTEIN: putative F-box protein At3g21120 [Camelina sativa]